MAGSSSRSSCCAGSTACWPTPRTRWSSGPSSSKDGSATLPVLASLDIEATQRFYADKLGFTAVARYPDYGIVERDNVQIHFWLTDDADIPKATSCRVDVDGVDQLTRR